MLDDELAILEAGFQTEAEQIDEESEIEDVASDMDEYLGEDAMESDMEQAYSAFFSNSETDYDGYFPEEIEDREIERSIENIFSGGGWHIEVAPDIEQEQGSRR